MITDLWIENFKGIGKCQHIPLRPITLLFGRNSAGKSTVLHALLYLREILVKHEFDPKLPLDGENTVSLGSMKQFLHDTLDVSESGLTIGVRFHPPERSINKYLQLFDRRGHRNGRDPQQPGARAESEQVEPAQEPNETGINLSGPIEIHFTIGPNTVEHYFFSKTYSEEYELRRQLKRLTISVSGSTFLDLELRSARRHSVDSEELCGYINLLSSVWNRHMMSDDNHDVAKSMLRSESTIAWSINDYMWDDDPKNTLLVLAPLETVEMRWIDSALAVDLLKSSDRVLQGYSAIRLTTYVQKIFPDEFERVLIPLGLDSEFECIVIVASNDEEERELETKALDPNQLIGVLFPDAMSHHDVSVVLDVIRTLHFPCDREEPDERASWTRRLKVADYRSLLPSDDPVLAVSFVQDRFSEIGHADSARRSGPECTVSRFVKGSLYCLAEELRQLTYLGPKRSTVPRTLSTDQITGCTDWGAGLAAWKWLLEADVDAVQRCNNWLASTEIGLGTGFEIAVACFREIRGSNLDWPSIDELEPLSLDPRSEPDTEHLILIKQQYEKVCRAFREAHLFKRLQLRDIARSTLRHPQDLGEGITQVVPVIVSCVKAAKSKSLVAIEQPELHLHPSLAAKLGDLFISTVFAETGGRTLIETHSEHIILRILRRIRQTTNEELPEHIPPVKPDDVCVLWVDNLGEGTTYTRLRISDQGRWLDRWPDGFFRERHEDLFE